MYKCHRYSIKGGKVYFNSRAVNLSNVMSITDKDGSILHENPDVQEVKTLRTPPKRDIVKRTPGRGAKRLKKVQEVIEI
jgi:hypothetical protein